MKPRTAGRLVALFHHRWAVPVLAELHRSSGAKFVTLAHRLGMSRDSLKRTLEALIREGLVLRNPGYGHPMRPEYILTPTGTRLAPWCVKAERVLARLGSEEITLRKWSLAVAYAIGEGHGRFSEMMGAVPGVSARALAMTLKNLQEAELVERVVREDYPPTTIYRLTPRGRRLAPLFATGIPRWTADPGPG